MDKERDQSKFVIQRFDSYISAANTKGNFLLAFNTFLCGCIVSNYKNLTGLINSQSNLKYLNIFLWSLFILGLVTTTLIMKSVYPFLKSGNSTKEKYHSLIFFNSVAEYDNDKSFKDVFQGQSDSEVNEDMARQAYYLAKALKSKYNILAWSMRFVFFELVILLAILILISI